GDPVTMIAGALLPRRPLHDLVLEHRRDPDGGGAEALDVIEALHHALEVAAVIEARARRVVAGVEPIARKPAAVVRRIAILEPVGQQEIDDLVLGQPGAIAVRGRGRRKQREGGQRGHQAGTSSRFTGANLATNAPCSAQRETSLTWLRSSPSRNSRSRDSGSRSAIG